ncbi:MAG: adenylate kinase [Spirochaetes bacterium]|nr:adenylate kinase [Spirochaetota bacterium]
MKLVFFGAPGAGKGTLAKVVMKELNIPQISTGDLFRQAIKDKTPLGQQVSDILAKGELVPDSLTISIVKERVEQADCKNGYILDGFPRTIIQAEEWEKVAPIDTAIYFDVTDDVVRRRLGSRRVCGNCGAIYNIISLKPKVEGVCDKCGKAQLIIRDDDQEEAINHRLEVYHAQTKPLLEFYDRIKKMVSINANHEVDSMFAEFKKVVK